ncbi:MAG: hypothetical protein P4M14_11580, partial [Gammaproteobacteria bacterium]|nr:hypothetical protein [Gammaproteobacteria bacterium]
GIREWTDKEHDAVGPPRSHLMLECRSRISRLRSNYFCQCLEFGKYRKYKCTEISARACGLAHGEERKSRTEMA